MTNENKKMNITKILVLVSILILSSLGFTLVTTGTDHNPGAGGLDDANQSGYLGNFKSSRQASPLVESVQPSIPLSTFVGEQDVTFDVVLQSLFTDDDNDMNGDNVLYDVEVDGTDAGIEADNLMKFDYETRQFVNVADPVFSWSTKSVAINSTDKNDYFLYTAGNYGPWKYIANNSNIYLDEDNSGTIDTGEYWSVRDGSKNYGDFMVNILGTAPPGYYRMKFKASYKYQQAQNVDVYGVGNGSDPDIAVGGNPDLFTNNALGPFVHYFWTPWDSNSNGFPTNLTATFGAGDLTYWKYVNYRESAQITPGSIDWEGMLDNGVDVPNSYTDDDNDGYTTWMPSDPDGNMGAITADFTAFMNYPGTPPDIDQSGNTPNNGNGTWTYSGRVPTPGILWGDPITHTEDVWFDFVINSTLFPDADLNEDNETNDLKLYATDNDYYTGSSFEEFYLNIGNMDPTVAMRDVEAKLYLPDPNDIPKGGFTIYKGRDTATILQIDPFENITMKYRLTVDPTTPPGFYYGGLELKYTKRFDTSELDAIGNPLTVDIDVTETHWNIQFEVDFTPEMGDATISLPSLAVRAKPNAQIDTSVSKQIFDFTVTNTGNTRLYGANMTDGNLFLNFAEFKQMGEGYYDADADPGIDFDPIDIDTINVAETLNKTIAVTIPNHWYLSEGKYRLYLNFSGYYFDDGALGTSSGFVYLEMDWIGANDDGQPRDCYVMIDKNGNGSVNDPEDSIRMIEGMFTDIYINPFDPTTKELAIIDWSPQILSQEDLMGGAYNFSVTFQNQQDFNMYDVNVEFDIEGYFDESYYYDWTIPTSRVNPKDYKDQLLPQEEWIVNFTIDDLDKLLPEGEHHIPVKYSYGYDEYSGVEERTTFGIIWDTTGSPFTPFIDANADFMLNKAAGSTRGDTNTMDIVFVVDASTRTSTTYRNYLRNALDSFATELSNNNINYEFALVGFNADSWVQQDLTTDTALIKTGINTFTGVTSSCGVYDAVTETLSNSFIGNTISYRPGATKVIIVLCQYYPQQGSNDETSFALACKGDCIFFGIVRTSYWGYYDSTALATGGQLFDIYGGSDFTPYTNAIVSTLSSFVSGVTPTGRMIYDVKLGAVADPESVNLDSYGPYIVVKVTDTGFDIDTAMISSAIRLGGKVRDVDVTILLTNNEYVRYTDIEIELPLTPNGETMAVFINPLEHDSSGSNQTSDDMTKVVGRLSSTTLEPDGGAIQATFNVDVNTNSDSGVFEFDLAFRAMNDYTKQQVSGTITVAIRVYPVQPILIIPQESVVAKDVKPGKKFDLTFLLENTGDDDAREVYVTLSNEWYLDDPFTTIDAFVTSLSSHSTSYYESGALKNVTRKANTKLSELGISDASDIVDVERTLMAPTAVIPRLYIKEIPAGLSESITITLRADTHIVEGRAYKEIILVEYIDSDGLEYRYDETNPELSTRPLPVTIYTKDNDQWPKEEGIQSETLAVILIIIIIIIIILLFLGSVYQKRRKGEGEAEPRRYKYREEEPSLEEEDELEEELPTEDEEFAGEKEPEEGEEKPVEEGENEWAIDDEKEIEEEEPDEEEPALEEEDDDDWAIDETESTKKPGKGKLPVKGKAPGKAKGPEKDEDEIEDW